MAEMGHSGHDVTAHPEHQFIDSKELARRWTLPESWIRDQVRARASDPIPHVRFGKYVRFRWGSSELNGWAERRIVGIGNKTRGWEGSSPRRGNE
jgi:hypothetical protein